MEEVSQLESVNVNVQAHGYDSNHYHASIQNQQYLLDLFHLGGKVAVVTGASSGIGQQIAITLANAGAQVVLVARNETALQQTVSKIRSQGGQAHACIADLQGNCSHFAHVLREPFGDPDILVNAAGVNLRQSVEEINLESWDTTLNVNLRAPFFLARSLVAAMKAKGHPHPGNAHHHVIVH